MTQSFAAMPDDFDLSTPQNKRTPTQDKVFTDEMMLLCFDIFEKTKNGQRFLQLLKQRYLTDAIVASPEISPNFAYYREGQRETVRCIISFITKQKQLLTEENKHD